MSNDAPIHECESEIDHYTGHYVPYFFPRMCGFFNVPQIFYYVCKGLKDGAYSLSTLSEKTRKSNCLQMLLRRQHFLLSYLKTLRVGPGRGLNPQPPTQQTGAYPIELTGRRLLLWEAGFKEIKHSVYIKLTLSLSLYVRFSWKQTNIYL